VILSFFDEKIKNDNVFKGAAIGALIVCALGVATDYGAPFGFVYSLPLSSIGFFWILPAAVCGIIGAFIPSKNK
ncbi:MAG: branched-chain amino acid transport system II carrier protein, partial [Clostridia bacterium]|nr:branched-chain amino acid transport system II carrier protein [Clostridia bacterium]